MKITEMTALEIGAAIKKGEITSPQAVQAFLDEIVSADSKINAYITVCGESALERSAEVQKRIERGETASPLAGVPIAIKDNICTKGIKTCCASRILGDFTPVYNATVIEKLEAAGAVVIGKLNMDEFAMGSTSETSFYGESKNPWDTSRVPGGSSGGAAAAVAAGEAVCALGSDTGGSIRQPASYCGVTGFKPTYGAVSRFGLIAYASSLDQIGPVARDVADCAAVMDVIKGKDRFDATSLDIGHPDYLSALDGDISGMRIGLPRECFTDSLSPDIAESILSAAESFRAMGATVEEISLSFLEYAVPAYYIIATAEASSNLSRFDGVKYGFRAKPAGGDFTGITEMYNRTRSEGFGWEVKKRILLGTFVLSSGYYEAYYNKALQVKSIIKNRFDEVFSQYDLILMPVAPTTAPRLGDSLGDPLQMYLSDIYTVSANIAGLPGLSLPCGVDKDDLPIGMQLLGQRLSETKVLNAGYAYQSATEFHKRRAVVM